MLTRRTLVTLAAAVTVLAAQPAGAQDKSIVVASTTSTQDSGLFGHILPLFKAKTGIDVKVVSQGTGQALDTGQRGDADVVFVHAKGLEEKFVADGFGVKRYPGDVQRLRPDRAEERSRRHQGHDGHRQGARGHQGARARTFISRGDRSGTHVAELNLWKAAGIDIAKDKADKTLGPWYREIGQGMGAALNTASASNAYVLADRGTWLSFKNRGDLDILVAGDKRMFNQYGVILVNPAKHPHVKKEVGQAFIDWLISPEGQKAIADYKINGEQLFFPNATCRGPDDWSLSPVLLWWRNR